MEIRGWSIPTFAWGANKAPKGRNPTEPRRHNPPFWATLPASLVGESPEARHDGNHAKQSICLRPPPGASGQTSEVPTDFQKAVHDLFPVCFAKSYRMPLSHASIWKYQMMGSSPHLERGRNIHLPSRIFRFKPRVVDLGALFYGFHGTFGTA